jgi:hypothetical protein
MVLRKLKVKSREPDGRSQNCYFLGGAKRTSKLDEKAHDAQAKGKGG